MANYKAIPPKQNKLDTLEKIKEHLGEEKFTKFIAAMESTEQGFTVTPAKLEEITGKGYSQNRRYVKIWRGEHASTN